MAMMRQKAVVHPPINAAVRSTKAFEADSWRADEFCEQLRSP
jgi:hypothetical protein